MGASTDALKLHKEREKKVMSEKDKNIKKIIIPAMAIIITIVIIGTLVRYFTTQQATQEVMVQFNEEQGLSDDYEVEMEMETETEEEENEAIEEEAEATEEITEADTTEEDTSINSTHTDIELSDDEYKGDDESNPDNIELEDWQKEIVDDVMADLMAEHPEWFTDTAPSTQTQQGNYQHVGTPSTGVVENPNYTVGESGGEGLSTGGTIY